MSLWTSPKAKHCPMPFEVARKVYEGDPHWPVEDEAVVRWMFSPQHAYGEGIDWAVCGVGDKARAGLFFDKNLLMDDVPAACFGYWEGLNDPEAHRELLSHAEQWAREKGAKKLYGPINYLDLLCVSNSDRRVFWMSLRFRASATILSTTSRCLRASDTPSENPIYLSAQMIMRFSAFEKVAEATEAEAQFGWVKGNGPDA